jgi:hypothetical protein
MQQNVVTYKVTICLDVNVPGKEAGGKQKCKTKMAALNSKKKYIYSLATEIWIPKSPKEPKTIKLPCQDLFHIKMPTCLDMPH